MGASSSSRFLGFAAALVCAPTAGQPAPLASPKPPYSVECPTANDTAPCRVDLATYIGKRVFDEFCATCHAVDAVGSNFAPALTARVANLDRRAFLTVLERGYRGEAAEMPPWAENPEVSRYAAALWTYLRARADGALRPGAVELVQ